MLSFKFALFTILSSHQQKNRYHPQRGRFLFRSLTPQENSFKLNEMAKDFNFALEAHQLTKEYWMEQVRVRALQGVSVQVKEGEFLAIAGESGSGKTTLLNLLGCLDRPSAGEILIKGQEVKTFSDTEMARFRAKHIGFIFQTFNLIPVLNALEAVEYPLLLLKVPRRERETRSSAALKRVGLGHVLKHRPGQMSGGQRQRVAIARALVKNPTLVFADEPTANLDRKTAIEILDLIKELHQRDRITFIISSHDPMVLSRAERVIWLEDGREALLR